MSVAALQALLSRKNQRFTCSRAEGTDSVRTRSRSFFDRVFLTPLRLPSSQARFVAHITHRVTGPLDLGQIDALEGRLGRQEQLSSFLSQYSSIRLYCDTWSDRSAFYLAHPDEWEALHSDFRPWIDDCSEDEKGEMFPEWVDDLMTIGEIPQSGNYLLLAVKGSERGKVFEFEHAENDFIEVGKDFNSFASYISTVTDSLIEKIGTHTRYSDGKTGTQWFPERYEYDQ